MSARTIALSGLATVLVAAAGPAWIGHVEREDTISWDSATIKLPPELGGWEQNLSDAHLDLMRPQGMITVNQQFRRGIRSVGFQGAFSWTHDEQGEALTFSATTMQDFGRDVHTLAKRSWTENVAGRKLVVVEKQVVVRDRRIVMWQWYRVGSVETPTFLRAKFEQGFSRLFGTPTLSALLTIFTDRTDNLDDARSALGSFLREVQPVYVSWFSLPLH